MHLDAILLGVTARELRIRYRIKNDSGLGVYADVVRDDRWGQLSNPPARALTALAAAAFAGEGVAVLRLGHTACSIDPTWAAGRSTYQLAQRFGPLGRRHNGRLQIFHAPGRTPSMLRDLLVRAGQRVESDLPTVDADAGEVGPCAAYIEPRSTLFLEDLRCPLPLAEWSDWSPPRRHGPTVRPVAIRAIRLQVDLGHFENGGTRLEPLADTRNAFFVDGMIRHRHTELLPVDPGAITMLVRSDPGWRSWITPPDRDVTATGSDRTRPVSG
ncbi:MAG: hypothetical protein AAGA56_13955 [Myxococcota bacterium]